MSSFSYKFCNNCGNLLNKNELNQTISYRIKLRHTKSFEYKYGPHSSQEFEIYDLCPACYKRISNFIESLISPNSFIYKNRQEQEKRKKKIAFDHKLKTSLWFRIKYYLGIVKNEEV